MRFLIKVADAFLTSRGSRVSVLQDGDFLRLKIFTSKQCWLGPSSQTRLKIVLVTMNPGGHHLATAALVVFLAVLFALAHGG